MACRSDVILSRHLFLVPWHGLFFSSSPNNNIFGSLSSPILPRCPSHIRRFSITKSSSGSSLPNLHASCLYTVYCMLGCSYDSTLLKRHNALCDILWHALLSDNKSCRREQNCSANHQSRPGDIYRPDFLSGKPAFLTPLSAIHCNHVLSALLPLKPVQPEMLEKWKRQGT